MPKKYVVIFDGVGTSGFLAAEFHKLGYACIHIDGPGEKSDYVKKVLSMKIMSKNLIIKKE